MCFVLQLSRVGLAISMYASSKGSDGDGGGAGSPVAEEEQSFSSIRNSELYPHNSKVVGKPFGRSYGASRANVVHILCVAFGFYR